MYAVISHNFKNHSKNFYKSLSYAVCKGWCDFVIFSLKINHSLLMSLIVPCSQQCDFFKKIDYKLKVITGVNKKIAQIHRYVSVLLVNIVI